MNETAFFREIAGLRRHLASLSEAAATAPREHLEHLAAGLDALEEAGRELVRDNEERLRIAIGSSPAWVFHQDAGLRYTRVYGPHPIISGLDLPGRTDAEVFLPEEAAELAALKTRVLETGEPVQKEIRLTVSGSTDRYDLALEPRYDGEGRIIGIAGSARSIADKKAVEQRFLDTERLLEAVFDNLGDIVGIQLPDRTIIRYNRATYEMLGMTPEEVAGKKCYEIIGRTAPCEVCATVDAVKSGRRQVIEKYVPELGQFLECRSSPILDEQGNVVMILEQLYDISERKRSEQALLRANAYNRSLIEAGLDPFATIDHEGAITDVNAEMEAVTGYSREELIGTNLAGYFSDPDAARTAYRKAFAKGHIRDHSLEISHRSGRRIPVLFNASVYRDESGAIAGVFTTARDITELVLAEESLRESEERFRIIFEKSPIGIGYYEEEGGFVDINAAGMRILGIDALAELTGFSIPRECPIPGEEREQLEQGATVHALVPFDFDKLRRQGVIPTRHSGIRYLDLLITPIQFRGGGLRRIYLVHIQDLTERIEIERAKQQAYCQINRNIEQFAVLSDHIRHPLQVIQGRADICGTEEAEKIREQVRRIDSLIRQLDRGWVESRKIREFLERHEL
ncbi:MAG: PAS domain S-box protein [Methanomicrobiaceae archaeon]|nr:PAS domain S-box protein [Methanomicrobiaceae archaeon]MDD5419075.1 PAS domain S-box protein [Methanomicrobiaceae archaeon]